MRQSKWTEQQIIGMLQQAETGIPVAARCRRIGVSKECIYRGRKKCGGGAGEPRTAPVTTHRSASSRIRR